MDELRKERLAINEALFRNVNEGMRAGHADTGTSLAIRCECGALGCNRMLEIDAALYEAVRAHPRRFVLLTGHDVPPWSGSSSATVASTSSRRWGSRATSPRSPTRAPRLGLALGQRQLRAEGEERAAEGPAHPGEHLRPASTCRRTAAAKRP